MSQTDKTELPQASESPGGGRRPDRMVRRRMRARRRKQLILRSTSVLPAMFTLGNGLAGFASIHFATKVDSAGHLILGNLAISAWLIFFAMLCDMLDGRLARMTRHTSDFGAQLDSLCDAVSFGVAPAMLTVRTASMALHGGITRLEFLPGEVNEMVVGRLLLCVAGVFVSCAVLRLARFNVENSPDEAAHMSFKGLPSPAAAAAVASLVLLLDHLDNIPMGIRSQPWMMEAVGLTLPVVTLLSGLLMVSRFRYPHLVNQYIRGKRPFTYLVKLLVIGLAALVEPFATVAVLAVMFAFSGPVRWLWRHKTQTPPPPAAVS